MDGKIDHLISDRQRIMSRYSVNWGASVPAVLWGSKLADPFSNGDSHSRTQNFVFDYTFNVLPKPPAPPPTSPMPTSNSSRLLTRRYQAK